ARPVARLYHEARRIGGVVDRAARVHLQLADRERGVVLEDHDLRLVAVDARILERAADEINRDVVFARDLVRAADVIVVLVRDHDAPDLPDVQPEHLQALLRVARPDPGVDEDGCPVRLEPVRVPGTARGEGSHDHVFDGNSSYRIPRQWNDSL